MTVPTDDRTDVLVPPGPQPTGAAARAVRPMSGRRRAMSRLRRRPEAIGAAAFLLFVIVLAVLGPLVAPHDPNAQDLRAILQWPSGEHLLGTDHLGRDVLSRLIDASRVAVQASVVAVSVALAIGVPLGLLIGYRGGWWDRIGMRIVEAIVSLPGIIVAVAILAILGPGVTNAMLAIGFVYGMAVLRLTRGTVLATREELFVDASRTIGTSDRSILFRHVLPNVASPLIIQTTLAFGGALLAEAGLAFLGLGVQPPQASWGGMLAQAAPYIGQQWFLAVPPGLAIALTVLALNLLGDGIRDSIGRGVEGGGLERARLARTTAPAAQRVPASAATPEEVGTDGPSAPTEAPVLDVRDLHISFASPRGDQLAAVSGVSFRIGPGETLGLVGESGCGKSATAMAMLGLLPVTAQVRVERFILDGGDVTAYTDDQVRRMRGGTVGTIFQDPMSSLNPALTVGSQLVEAIRLHRPATKAEARARARALLDLVRIPNAADRLRSYPHEMSGGMAQRTMIAMALACGPKLLIADEPTTALDVTVQGQVIDLLRDLQAELRMAILFISHDLGVIADVCDRASVMYAGEIVESAPVEEPLFASPQHPYTIGLLASRPRRDLDGEPLRAIPGSVPVPGSWPVGCRFQDRCELVDEHVCLVPQQLRSISAPSHLVRCARAELNVSEEVR